MIIRLATKDASQPENTNTGIGSRASAVHTCGESRAHCVDPVSCSVHARLCGESRAHRVNPVSCSVHPRVYGGKSCAPCRRGVLLGASPRVRGKVVRTVWTRCPARYTPALAGNTTSASIPRSCSVHPRTRGEHNSSEHPMILLGSPPRVRGVQQLRSNPHRTRSTPALAGNPASASNPSSCSVHPRSARGNSATASMPASCSVHPRSARGILHQRAIHHPARSTPAACGESQVRSSFHNHFLNRAPCGRSDDKLSLLRAYGGRACRATQALRPLRVTPVRAGPPTQTSATTSQAVQPAVDQTTSSHISEPTGAGHLAPLVPSDIFDAPRTRGDCHHPAPFCDHFRSPCPAVDQTKSSDIPEHTGAWNLAPLVPSVLFDALSHSREIPLSIIVRWSSCGDEATRECSTGLRFALLAPRKHTTRRGRC